MIVFHENQVPWPVEKQPTKDRKYGQFKSGGAPISLPEAAARVRDQVSKFSGKYWRTKELWIYCEGKIGAGRRFLTNQPKGTDPKVVVSFDIDDTPYLIAVDKLTDAAQNLAAIAAFIEAMRQQERYGIFTAAELLQQFAALPMTGVGHEVGSPFDGLTTEDGISAKYRELAMELHPDHGGSDAAMAQLNAQKEEAMRRVG